MRKNTISSYEYTQPFSELIQLSIHFFYSSMFDVHRAKNVYEYIFSKTCTFQQKSELHNTNFKSLSWNEILFTSQERALKIEE